MPRNPSGVYSLPGGSTVANGDTSDASDINTPFADLEADMNTARPVVAGGTGASTASAARTNLGLEIGTDVQAYDAGLASIAGLTTTAGRLIYTTAADTYAVTGLSEYARAFLSDADAATARGRLGLAIGTDVQAYDAQLTTLAALSSGEVGNLTDIAALTPTNGNFIVGDGTDWVVESGATARGTLGLGTMATQAATSVNIDGGAIDGTVIGANSAANGTFTRVYGSSAAGAVAPAYTFDDDPDTGIFNGGSNSGRLQFTNQGTTSVVIDAAGSMGIGTSSPESILHVKSGTGLAYDWSSTSSGILIEASGSLGDTHPLIVQTGKSIEALKLSDNGNLSVHGALSKGSGSFKIDHPLPTKTDTHHLVHSFIEGPRADLIYRGTVDLVSGAASVDIDTAAGMTAGTFEALCREPQVWVQNNSGWTQVRGSVTGATLSIEAQDGACTDTVSWLVIAERCDPHMIATDWTDETGRVIVEPEKTPAA